MIQFPDKLNHLAGKMIHPAVQPEDSHKAELAQLWAPLLHAVFPGHGSSMIEEMPAKDSQGSVCGI